MTVPETFISVVYFRQKEFFEKIKRMINIQTEVEKHSCIL